MSRINIMGICIDIIKLLNRGDLSESLLGKYHDAAGYLTVKAGEGRSSFTIFMVPRNRSTSRRTWFRGLVVGSPGRCL